MPGKPKIAVDQEGDGDYDVEVEIEDLGTAPADLPPHTKALLTDLVASMEVHLSAGVQRRSYAQVREALRTLVNWTP